MVYRCAILLTRRTDSAQRECIVDGRNRLLACRQAGVEPRFVEWRDIYAGDLSVSNWTWTVNAERRHLTSDQLAAAAVKFTAITERDAAHQRKIDGGKQGGGAAGKGRRKLNRVPTISSDAYDGVGPNAAAEIAKETKPKKDHSGEVRARIAATAHVSEYKAQQALDLEEEAPALLDSVINGEMRLGKAHKQIRPDVRTGKQLASANVEIARSCPVSFDLEAAITATVRKVEADRDKVPEEHQDTFLREVAEMVRRL